MELPQPRPFGTEGRKSTHDFLSLYSPAQQDPRSSQGGYLKTHDFLQPLEGKNIAKEENIAEPPDTEKPPPPAAPPLSSVEHILPGGIGTYSISHISYVNQRVPKPEGVMFPVAEGRSSSDRNDDNSNCSSYSGSGFTLWDESVVTKSKGQTGKENNVAGAERHAVREAGAGVGGQWATSLEQQSQTSSGHRLHKTFSSLSSSQPSLSQKNQSFLDMIKSAKSGQEDEDEDDNGYAIKKEPSSNQKGNLSVKVDGKCIDQKPNTPRSKHSATEQRRRSKINDRFQTLRELIPNSDQKRDKASFLLEVIEYIQFLQERVHKNEDPYQGWNQKPPKLMPWKNTHTTPEGFVDQSRATNCGPGPALIFAAKYDETNVNVSPTTPLSGQNLVESNISTANALKEMDHHRRQTNKALPLPLQQTKFFPGGSSSAGGPLPPQLASQRQSQLRENRSCTIDSTVASDKLKDQEPTIESGTISVSSVYSQGLLNTLTQALESSGVDLSQARISVQVDFGNRANSAINLSTSIAKTEDLPPNNQMVPQSRPANTGNGSEQAFKKLKTGRN